VSKERKTATPGKAASRRHSQASLAEKSGLQAIFSAAQRPPPNKPHGR